MKRKPPRTGFTPGLLVVVYYALAAPLGVFGAIAMLNVLESGNSWLAPLGFFGLIAIYFLFVGGQNWAREKDQLIAQRARDHRAVWIYNRLSAHQYDELARPYSLYLRPFSSTGHVRIAIASRVYKRGVLAGPGRTYDPELGSTELYKRYVTFADFETELARVVEPLAPLIGLGRPGEQIGAGRIESEHKDWRDKLALLAEHAMVIFLVPSTNAGTQWEMERIRDNARLLHKTVLFIPPDDTVLGGGVGPFLSVGARKGPVGKSNLRQVAIKALPRLVHNAPIQRIKRDEWGVFLRLTDSRRVGSYHALSMVEGLSLNPFSVGSNLHIDRTHMRSEIQEILRLNRAEHEK